MTLRLIVALVTACPLAAAPLVEAPAGAGQLVIRFSDGFGEAGGDPRIVLEIYGDGRAVVTRPPFVLGSAHAETRLGRAETARLLASMAAHGVLELDAAAARKELSAAEARRSEAARARPGEVELIAWTDPDPTTLEVHAAYMPAGGGEVQRDVVRVVSWTGLRGDVAVHPEIASLHALHAAQEELRAVIARKDLR